ncbi:LysR family transcriptional regulator [Tsukamurella pseudospumae]|uniref:LysR family transcriptional regulator n=1 Tax=Tsukamurella pseudospumae TaxID=239498 RepID=A0A137YTI2_9ACTN|nr:LysR family transcriptional regulator [Tsukamurella pseudospumae]KXO89175.1 LysR family transcriptional regulator [Tsukamurella pseudospumae]
MELQQLRYVIAVSETLNFTRAAERCHVVQSALSHRVAALEKDLGARLFDRTNRSVRLTRAGEAFLPQARAALAAVDRAADEVAATTGAVRGTVTVGMIPTFTAFDVVEVLRAYRAAHPDAGVRLRSGPSEHLLEDVRTGTVDLALLGVPDGFSTAGVVARRLSVDRLVLVVPESEEVDGPLTLAQAAERPFADYPTGGAGRAETDQAFDRAGVRRTVAFEVDRSETMLELIGAGLCVGTAARETVPDGVGLAVVPLVDGPTRSQLLVHSKLLSPAARALLTVVDQHSA